MSLHKHRTLPKRSGVLPASGSVIESDPTPTATYLAQNSAEATNTGLNPTGFPLAASSIYDDTSTAATQLSTPTAASNSTSSSSNQPSLGTVIGACVAAFIALLLAVALAYYCSRRQKQTPGYSRSRNATGNPSRRRSHLEAWKRIDDDDEDQWDGRDGRDRPMRQRPPSGPLGAMFHRTASNTSGDKSLEGHNRESVGTMQHFVKYHPSLAAEMASQGTTAARDEVTKPQPVLHLMGRSVDMNPPISWDGETVREDSIMSSLSKSMATAKSTPVATTSFLHRWERAEVVHVGSDFSERRNPFLDRANSIKSSIRSSTRGQNPFFGARDYSVKRTLLPDMHKDPFADSNVSRDSSSAIRSLIAALEEPYPPGSSDRIASIQSSVYSRATADDGESAISVTAFPYPPTQISLR